MLFLVYPRCGQNAGVRAYVCLETFLYNPQRRLSAIQAHIYAHHVSFAVCAHLLPAPLTPSDLGKRRTRRRRRRPPRWRTPLARSEPVCLRRIFLAFELRLGVFVRRQKSLELEHPGVAWRLSQVRPRCSVAKLAGV